MLILAAVGPAAAETAPEQHIMLLYAYGYGGRGVELFSDGFFKAITEAGFPVSNVHAEYLDLQRNGDRPGYRRELLDLLRQKYAQQRIDLIVTVQQPALDFLLTDGKEIAPQAPVITIQHRPLLDSEKTGRRIVGEVNQFDIRGTLERALELFPHTQRVLFASGSSPADQALVRHIAEVVAPWRGRLDFEFTTDRALDDILHRVANLPAHSVIVFTQYNVDSRGQVALAYEIENKIIQVANAPVFGFYDYNLKNGGIGGSVIAVEASGARIGRQALALLHGDGPAVGGQLNVNESIPLFDWQQIERWGGDVRRLPASSRFVNRPPSAWQQFGGLILGSLLFVAALVVMIVVLLVNIRRRQQAELVREASEQRFRATFEQAAVGIALVAPDGRWLRVNDKLCRIVGYSQEELLACSFQDITHADDLAADLAAMQEMLAGRRDAYSMEKRYRRKNGETVWINLSVALIRRANGQPDYFVSVVEDIEPRKEAERRLHEAQAGLIKEREQARLAALNRMEDAIAARQQAEQANAALRESREKLQLFIEHAPAALAMFDRDMRYLAFSRRWLSDYSLGNRPIAGLCHYEVFPEIPERWKAIHRRGLAGEVVRADADCLERRDGRRMWLRWEVRPWHAADGSIGGIVVFSEDITRFKAAEDEIRQLNASLERRVAERTAELTAANKELDSFAYAVSHDLRAPLRAMSGFSQALLEDYGGQLAGEAKSYLEQIRLASAKMGELIDGILALSRSTRGDLHCDMVDLSALAAELLAELARAEPGRPVDVGVAPGLRLYGDPRMIEVVMRNLLGNAWKYTGKSSAPSIRVHAGEIDGQPAVCVSDNGAGFDMAYAEQLFQPFRRLHRQDEFPGIGIGLATVQRIVHRHGGAIRAQGTPGVGASFCFVLAPPEQAAA